MALDLNAGKKKAVGLARNLFPTATNDSSQSTSTSLTTVSEALAAKPVVFEATFSTTAKNQNRIKKVSFMIDPVLEKRFRTARLKAGFEKLEDAYNEALKKFCELSEQGKIDNF